MSTTSTGLSKWEKGAARAASPSRDLPAPRAAYTINEFCEAHRISRSFFYKLKKSGKGPRVKNANGKPLITREDAAAWRASDDDAA
jgi:hypothetical protein